MTLAQLTLGEIEIRRARRSDPATSKEAASQSHGLAAEHHLLILAALRDCGPQSCTELAVRTGLHVHQVGRRMCELCGPTIAKVRVREGETRPTAAGRASRVYELVEAIAT